MDTPQWSLASGYRRWKFRYVTYVLLTALCASFLIPLSAPAVKYNVFPSYTEAINSRVNSEHTALLTSSRINEIEFFKDRSVGQEDTKSNQSSVSTIDFKNIEEQPPINRKLQSSAAAQEINCELCKAQVRISYFSMNVFFVNGA